MSISNPINLDTTAGDALTNSPELFAGTEISARIGLLVPPPNVVMEREFYRSLPADIALHTSHMYRSTPNVTVDSLLEMVDNAAQAALTVKMTLPDVVLFGCTSGSFIMGLGWDEQVAQRIGAAAGVRGLTTSTAVVRCLQSIGARRVAVATPYTADINQREADFFESHGFTVTAIEGLELLNSADMGRTPLKTTYELGLKVARAAEIDALFVSCTNLRTLEAIAPLEKALGKPVVSSNLASLWYALDQIGHTERFTFGGSRLLDWQRRRAPK